MKRTLTAVAVVLLAAGAIGAQADDPTATFDVVSIRRNESLSTGGSIFVSPAGAFRATNISARNLIGWAYDIPATRVLDAPAWAADERYVIEARAEGISSIPQARPLAVNLLRDRFQLRARREIRELPVYMLRVARSDGTLGPRMRKTDRDCLNREAAAKATAAAPPGTMVCGIGFDTGRLNGGAMIVDNLVGTLTGASGRPVLNRTGLEGKYDIELAWAPTPDAEGLSIFTAVEEQLGLKLESSTAPLDIIIVERIERPSEN